jgi:LCP family protein required for cell wall assembly
MHGNGPGPRRSWLQRLVLATGGLMALAMFAGAALVGFGWSKVNRFERVQVELSDVARGQPVNFLVVGSDSRENIDPDDPDAGAFLDTDEEFGGHRADTMIVARIDPEAGTVALLSIPRDLYIVLPSGGKDRINTAYGDGPQALVDAIQTNLDIPINHYVEVDFVAFKRLVDELGGIPLYFDQPMRDLHTGLEVNEGGCIVLQGQQALAFARSRHLEVYDADTDTWNEDPSADLGRITRQQLFLRKAMDKAATLGLDDVFTLNRLADVATDNVGFDQGLEISEGISLARKFARAGGEAITTYSLPTLPFTTPDGAEVLRLLDREAQPALDVFRGVTPGPPPVALTPDKVAVRVLNGTGIQGQAAEAADRLRRYGFAVGEVGDAGLDASRTTVSYGPGMRDAADLVLATLRSPAELVEDAAAGPNITLTTGADFAGVNLAEAVPLPAGGAVTPASVPADLTTSTVGGAAGPVTAVAPEVNAQVGFVPGEAPPGVTCG